MSTINEHEIAMQKVNNAWYIKHISDKMFYELNGSLTTLWECLHAEINIDDAKSRFLNIYDNHPQAVADLPNMIGFLFKSKLLRGSQSDLDYVPVFTEMTNNFDNNSTIQSKMTAESIKLGRPVLAEYEMTYRCNLRCSYCYQPNYLKHERKNELNKDELTSMLTDFANSGVFFFSLSGGECTLMPNFNHIIQEARRNLLDVTVLTNGTAIKPRVLKTLCDSRVSKIKISIYGASSEEYKEFTRFSAGYDRVIKNIKLMKEAGLNVVAKIIITSFQESTYKKSVEYFRENDIPVELSCHVMPALDGDLFPLKYRVSNDTIKELMQSGDIKLEGGCRSCTAATAKFRVSPEGEVSACELSRTPLGNIRDASILSILGSDTTKEVKSTIWDAIKKREKKVIWALPCPAISKIEHDDWQKPSDEAIRWTKLAEEVKSAQ